MFSAIETVQLQRLRAVATKLYREERLNGDEMRDLGHEITAVLNQALDMPESGVLVFAPKKCDHPNCGGSLEALVCNNCRAY